MPGPALPQSYQSLRAWNLAIDLAARTWEVTRTLPESERFGMTSQMRRAAASIPANIAEGYGRLSRREYRRFVAIANGSLKELETHSCLAGRLGLLHDDAVRPLMEACAELGRVLYGLHKSLG